MDHPGVILKHFRADEHSNGTTNDDDVNAETPGENGNDENEDYENGNESDDDDDDDEDDTSFNVNYGVVTAIRALAVKGRYRVRHQVSSKVLLKYFMAVPLQLLCSQARIQL